MKIKTQKYSLFAQSKNFDHHGRPKTEKVDAFFKDFNFLILCGV